MDFELQTAQLRLRPIQDTDVDALLALDSDPEVMKYISGGQPTTRRDYEELLPRMMAYGPGPIGYFAAMLRTEKRFVGWFHLRPSVVDPEILELGYRLAASVWGRGLATEGSLALLHNAFGPLEQVAVDACTVPENAASIAVMQKCGMREVGSFLHPRGQVLCLRYLVDAATFGKRAKQS